MSEAAFATQPPRVAIPGAAAPDPRIARAEQRLTMLRELAELGMAMGRELTRRTLQSPETPEPTPATTRPTPSPASHAPCASPWRSRPRSRKT
jgi:hypothetical protein